MMNMYVILKQTFDTEEKIFIEQGGIVRDGVKLIINPYDEYAVEEALRLKERHGGTVTVISVGPSSAAEALRTALAMGADEAVQVLDEGLSTDETGVAEILAAYLRTVNYDLLLGGYFSVDNGAGQVAIRLAKLLELPHVSSIVQLEIQDGHAKVVRDAEGDSESLSIKLPALFTAQQGLNEPRYPSLPGIMKAKKKPFKELVLSELGLEIKDVIPRTERVALFLPHPRKTGRILAGSASEQAELLAKLLRTEAKVI